jgi:hypothetical protein
LSVSSIVGEQHLWVERNYLVFEAPERPLGPSKKLDLASDAEAAMSGLMAMASAAVRRRVEEHGEGAEALRRLVRLDDDLNAGIAAAVAGDKNTAVRGLSGQIHEAFASQAAAYLEAFDAGGR